MRQKTVIKKLLESVTDTKRNRSLLQSVSGITKCGRLLWQISSVITKCDNYYKVRRNLHVRNFGMYEIAKKRERKFSIFQALN